jgi:HlyD family secretion protein
VIDLLSQDAVQVSAGSPVIFERWGGEGVLRGIVRRVEPSGFTRVSALGVEEQRVNVIVDFELTPEQRQVIGDGYRVDARVVVWQSPDVIKVPTGALVRDGRQWAVFLVEGNRARLRRVEIGQVGDLEAEVIDGLEHGATVILHPGDNVRPGALVRERG